MTCSIPSCKNHRKKKGELSFFRFPKSADKAVLEAWLRCCPGKNINLDQARVCSEHFLESDYDPAYITRKSLMPGVTVKPWLRKGAVPTQKLRASISTTKTPAKGPASAGKKTPAGKNAAGTKDAGKTAAGRKDDGADSDDSVKQRWEKSRQLRQERQERKEREWREFQRREQERKERLEREEKEKRERVERRQLVERLLAEHEQKLRKPASPVKVIEMVPRRGGSFKPQQSFTADDDDDMADDFGGPEDSQTGGESSVSVERMRKIVRLQLRLRRLECQCIRALAGPRVQEATPATPAGKPSYPRPLMVLRDGRYAAVDSGRIPTIVAQLRRTQLPETLATFTPTDLQSAHDVNHRLKVMFIKMQSDVLRWAVKNKRLTDARARDAESRRQKRTLGAARLKELLQLEAAVKAMFTEAQLRAIVRDHVAATSQAGGGEVRRYKSHWSDEDVRRALELRALGSDRIVQHVRDKMKIPLPGYKTIRKRCVQTPALADAYRQMVQQRQEARKRCVDCERQLNTIQGVVNGDGDVDVEPPPTPWDDAAEAAAAAAELEAGVPRSALRGQPKIRRRAPASASVPVAKKRRVCVVPPPQPAREEWEETSDSDAELSDPGIWGRIDMQLARRYGGALGAVGRSPDAAGRYGGPPGLVGRPPEADYSELDPLQQELHRRSWR